MYLIKISVDMMVEDRISVVTMVVDACRRNGMLLITK